MATLTKYEQALGQPAIHTRVDAKLADPSVKRVLAKAKRRYAALDADRLSQALDWALVRAVVDHDDSKGTFERSLWRFIKWETGRAWRSHNRLRAKAHFVDSDPDRIDPGYVKHSGHGLRGPEMELWEHVKRYLTTPCYRVVLGYYREGRTLEELADSEGVGKDAIVKRLADGLEKLRQVELFKDFAEGITCE